MNYICMTKYIHCFTLNKYTKCFLIPKLTTDHRLKLQSTLDTSLGVIFSSVLNRKYADLKNPIIKSKKCRPRQHLKAILFCHEKKADRLCLKSFWTPSIKVQQVFQPPISKPMSPFSAIPVFQPPVHNQQNGKQILSLTTSFRQDYPEEYIL